MILVGFLEGSQEPIELLWRVFRERTRIRVQREGVSNDQLKGLDRTDVLQETYGAAVEPVWGVRGLRQVKEEGIRRVVVVECFT